jgi:thiol-disulfide isomerase/thioredoxin
VVSGFGGRVAFVIENYGDSELAERFGVRRYPAIFVDEVLVATPKDFGFYGQGEGADDGRYAPWREAASHERFRVDLKRMLDKVLAGKKDAVRSEVATSRREPAGAETARSGFSPPSLPDVALVDLEGRPITRSDLAGKAVLVEFWATWCPPCRGTLAKLGELRRRSRGRLEVVALAVESDPEAVKKVAAGMALPLRWGMGSPEIARRFGDLSAVPTLFLFDAEGRTREIFYGAPPDLEARLEKELSALLD